MIVHNNPVSGGSVDSNKGHLSALKHGLRDIKKRPLFGCGPGCAGPASQYSKAGLRIAENYFVQIAQESGLIGLALLLAVFGLVAWQLWQSNNSAANVLLASFVGIAVASLFAHAWADDTITYVWWGLAGLTWYRIRQDSAVASATHHGTFHPNSSEPAT